MVSAAPCWGRKRVPVWDASAIAYGVAVHLQQETPAEHRTDGCRCRNVQRVLAGVRDWRHDHERKGRRQNGESPMRRYSASCVADTNALASERDETRDREPSPTDTSANPTDHMTPIKTPTGLQAP